MSTTLLIVESPSKAQKIQEYLGKNYKVLASYGHITDLAKGGKFGIGIDINNNFKPKYVIMEDKIKVLDEILNEAKKSDLILLSSDPDREGESISWHLAQRLADVGKPIKRVTFNEIKKSIILKAIKSPRDIDMNLFHAQECRRILDRLVGFMASPFLINFFGPKLSAGRVQSVVTRLIIDREREIETFVPENFWTIQAKLTTNNNESFIVKYSGKITDQAKADKLKNSLNVSDYVISEVISKEEKKKPQPPLETLTLQRIMSKNYGFSPDRTMKAAQSLYESGYCTYIRTDSVRVGDEALQDLRDWIKNNNYDLPNKAHSYDNKEASQDAHECIRPSDVTLHPATQMAIIDPDEKIVYENIWKYFIASQMMPAVYDTLSVTAYPQGNPSVKVKVTGKALKYKGYLDLLNTNDDSKIDIPNLTVGEIVHLSEKNSLKVEKKQTQPPPRFSEEKLLKELKDRKIGRPATYADLLSKISNRNYVEKKGNVYHATDLGKKITDELTQYFTFMDYNYTQKMESELDEIEGGKINHIDMLKKFFPEFKKELDKAYVSHGGNLCEKCGSPMSTRTAKNGSKFMGCSGYPRCKFTLNIISGS